MKLSEFGALDPIRASRVVKVWADVPDWIETIVERRPYSSVQALADTALGLAEQWQPTDLDHALAQHPRIGENDPGSGAEAASSRREQALVAAADDQLTTALAAGNRAYEEKFGRVFLIRAAGRGPQELLSELQRRLTNDPDAETDEALQQLADIALLRLHSEFVED